MSTTLLVEAKREYTEQLVLFLRDAMYDDFYVLWKESVESPDPMMKFQEKLEDVVDWDEKTMIQRTDKCVSKTGCKFLDDLIVAVFVAHMKILMSIKNDKAKEQYKLQVPTTNKFVYECLLQCSREFWKSPYIFYQNELENKIKKVQIQKNLRQAEDIISRSIKNTIRGMLPVKEIVGDVFEYDKDGDLILDIKRTDFQNKPKGADDTTQDDKKDTNKDGEDKEETRISDESEETKESDTEKGDKTVPPAPTLDTSGVNVTSITSDDSAQPINPTVTPDVSNDAGEGVDVNDGGDGGDGSKDLLKETIENIRVMSSEHKEMAKDLEYDPFKEQKIPANEESKELGDGDDGDSSVVDWNKGFVLGPVEEDLTIDVEPIEKESKDDIDMSDVVELE